MELQKVIVKVQHNNKWAWVHFCYVYSSLYNAFFKVTGCEKSEFGNFLSIWAKGDFNLKLNMSTYEDLQQLKKVINESAMADYSELYSLNPEENPRIQGWVRLWVSQHMRVEIAAREGE